MLGEKIKKLRTDNSLTQKELAEKLFVTAQAVSRWENNEVEPSISTVSEMAKIFNVSIGELVGEEQPKEQKQQIVEPEEELVELKTEYLNKEEEQQKVVLAVCEKCNRPIFNSDDIVRKGYGEYKEVICKDCDIKTKETNRRYQIKNSKDQRRKSFVWGGILTGLILVITLIILCKLELETPTIVWGTVATLIFFPFISCLFLDNNFIMVMVVGIAGFSVRFPGLIFSLDLDGIIWFITVKIVFWLLGMLISLACFLLAVALGMAVSLFVYPFALARSVNRPEETGKAF